MAQQVWMLATKSDILVQHGKEIQLPQAVLIYTDIYTNKIKAIIYIIHIYP